MVDSRVCVARVRSMVVGSLVAGLLIGSGCAELITYSNKSNAQGEKFLDAGEYEQAAGAFRNGAKQNPSNYESFYGLGVAYDSLGREQQALQGYRGAVEIMPAANKGPEARAFREKAVNGLARCIAKSTSREAEVSASVEKANKTNSATDWYVLARTYAITGDADNALDAYGRATRASENRDPAIAKSHGLYLAQIGQTQQAEAALRKAYQLAPADPEVNAALRKLGVVPGPSLLTEGQLRKPLVPKGPIPEVELNVKDKNKPS